MTETNTREGQRLRALRHACRSLASEGGDSYAFTDADVAHLRTVATAERGPPGDCEAGAPLTDAELATCQRLADAFARWWKWQRSGEATAFASGWKTWPAPPLGAAPYPMEF